MRNAFIDRVLHECDRRDDIYILSGDAGLGVFDTFREKCPERFLNMGVAEQNTISFAAGLALTGFRVVIYNIAPFVLYRCYEQVRNDICYQELPVVLVGTGSGITYAPMGMSHYAVEDLGLTQTLPNLTVISPMDPVEARAAADFSLACTGPVYVRLAKRGEPTYHPDAVKDIAIPQVIRNGCDVAVLFHGSISEEVMIACTELAQRELFPQVISVPTIQPLAVRELVALLDRVNHVVCVEEHFTNCGLGQRIAALKVESGAGWGLTTLGIPPGFIHKVADVKSLRSACGITADALVRTIEKILTVG